MIDNTLAKLFKLVKYPGFPDHVVDFIRAGVVVTNGKPITDMKYFEYDWEKHSLKILDHVSSFSTIEETND